MKQIDADQLNDLMESDEDVLVVDVLPEDLFNTRHIPSALNVPVGQSRFAERVRGIADSLDQPVVVYCADTDCDLSPKAATELEEEGFTNVHDLHGGIAEWRAKGYAVSPS